MERLTRLQRSLPEMLELEELARLAAGLGDVEVIAETRVDDVDLPVYAFAFGPKVPVVPRFVVVGGVHGLERVGTSVAVAWLRSLLELLAWDRGLQHLLTGCRVIVVPLLNPGGMWAKTRANPRGVDLMRNAPLDAEVSSNVGMIAGHRFSSRLPWYRGEAGAPLEPEAQALVDLVRRDVLPSPFSLALDLHSGFGLVDRLWFPYAYTRRPFDHLGPMLAFKDRLERSLPNHPYLVEPQSTSYVTHGDLWDFLYLEQRRDRPEHMFLPMTLEMGSWLWIRKNPRQALTALGIFNPLLPHRLQRTLRRHQALLDFCLRVVVSHDPWLTAANADPERASAARKLWFRE